MTPAHLETYLDSLHTSDGIKEMFRRYGIRYAWLAMATVMLAMMATLLASTIINVAIPQIMGAYGIGQDKAQWLSTANLAASTIGMLMTGWMIQLWGLRKMVIGVMSFFMLGSLLGGISPNLEIMVIARIIQGVCAGLIVPLSTSIIFMLFPTGKMGMVMGLSSIGVILAPALGPAVGGTLIDNYSWHYVFFLAVPFSLACVPMAWIFLPDRDENKPKLPLDWPGLILLTGAISCLLLGLSNGEKEGWSSSIILGLLILSVALGGAFMVWQTHNRAPLLNLKLYANRQYAIYSLTAFVFGAGLFGSTYLIPLFLQMVQGFTPTDTGLAMIPAGIIMAATMPPLGRLADKLDARFLITIGIGFFAFSFYLMQSGDANTGFWTIAWWMTLGRIGIAFAIPPLNLGGMKAAGPEHVSQAAGALNFIRQLGGAFGVNLISIALARRTEFHADSLLATQTPDNTMAAEVIHSIAGKMAAEGYTVVEQQAGGLAYLGQMIHTQAVIISFQDCFLLGALAFMLTLIPTWMIRGQSKR